MRNSAPYAAFLYLTMAPLVCFGQATAFGEIVTYVEPRLPQTALKMGIQNTSTPAQGFLPSRSSCELNLVIAVNGTVRRADIEKGADDPICFDVEKTLLRWVYRQPPKDGTPIEMTRRVTVPFEFQFHDVDGQNYSLDSIRQEYDRKFQKALLPNPHNITVHFPIYLRDRDGDTFVAAYRNGNNLLRRPGNPADFVIAKVFLEEIVSFLDMEGYNRNRTERQSLPNFYDAAVIARANGLDNAARAILNRGMQQAFPSMRIARFGGSGFSLPGFMDQVAHSEPFSVYAAR